MNLYDDLLAFYALNEGSGAVNHSLVNDSLIEAAWVNPDTALSWVASGAGWGNGKAVAFSGVGSNADFVTWGHPLCMAMDSDSRLASVYLLSPGSSSRRFRVART